MPFFRKSTLAVLVAAACNPAADDADLFKDEADVAMARNLRRHGSTRLNNRGIDANRL